MAEAVKKCRPFLQRAEELAAVEPIVSYYCRFHAVQLLGKAYASGDAQARALLEQELVKAETAKRGLDLSLGRDVMEGFALSVFDAADAADRAGTVSPMQLYAASLFLEVCAQFHDGELPPDLAEKAKYARYRAIQVKQGAGPPQPTEGPEAAPAAAAAAAASSSASSTAPASFAPAGYPAAPPEDAPRPAAAAPAPAAAAAPVAVAAPAASPVVRLAAAPSTASAAEARKEAKRQVGLAQGALDFRDVATARICLQQALQLLDHVA